MTGRSGYISQICALRESQILSFGWSYILDEYVLERHKVALNVHPTLLTKFVGPTTVANVVLEDERATGLTLHLMISEPDGGAILALQPKTLTDFPPARTPEASKIDSPKPVEESHDEIRTSDSDASPAHFFLEGQKVRIEFWREERSPHEEEIV